MDQKHEQTLTEQSNFLNPGRPAIGTLYYLYMYMYNKTWEILLSISYLFFPQQNDSMTV